MKSRHLFEENIYFIQNFSVARNQLFQDESDREVFLETLDEYLSPICDILEYSLFRGHYSIHVKLKTRIDFIRYFISRHEGAIINQEFIPESSFIFSQAMANFQVSYVKYFNFRYKRKGGLFACRFRRELIENKVEFNYYKNMMHQMECKDIKDGIWVPLLEAEENNNQDMDWYLRGSGVEEGEGKENPIIRCKKVDPTIDLRGQILKIPEIDIIPTFHRQLFKIFRRKHPCWPNCN